MRQRRHSASARAVNRPRIARATACFLLAGGLGACTLGPDYARPDIDVPANYRFADAAKATEAAAHPDPTLAEVTPWWQGFHDPQLDALVTEGLAANRNLRVAIARVDEFAARLQSTEGGRYPKVGYGVTAGRARASVSGLPPILADNINPVASSYSGLLSASWEPDLWGRLRREIEASRADLMATDQARRGVALTVVAAIVTGYVNLLDLDRQLKISEDTLKVRQASVKVFRQRFEGGTISDFEMQQVLAEYEIAVAAIPQAKRLIAVQENALSVLLGRNPGPIARAGSLEALGRPQVPAGLPASLLERRPDIQQAEQQLISANARIGVARALYYPSISLTGALGASSPELGDLFSGPSRTWSFVGQLLGPIFAGGSIKAANAQADARREQALASYEGTIQDAFRDVDDALATVVSSRAVQDASERRTASLRRARELANERYENGYSDYLELLDTERSLFSAELSLSSARGDSYRSLVDLYRALGGDWAATSAGAEHNPESTGPTVPEGSP
jgi:multidrug efflux system outer membrane protein